MTAGLLPSAGSRLIGVGSVGIAAILALIVMLALPGRRRRPVHAKSSGRWIAVGGFTPQIGFYLDALSLVMMLVITFVSFLIHLYSAEFMEGDEGYSRFFAYMNLFVASMLVLVLADNLLLLYLGWEGVGLCSYLLIGFWYRDPANGLAARKAFIVTRIGDTAMAIGLFLLFTNLGTLDIQPLMQHAVAHWPVGIGAADRRGGAAARRRGRQIRATAAADLAARRDGRPDASQRADPCRDHGDGWRVSHRPHACAVLICAAGRSSPSA